MTSDDDANTARTHLSTGGGVLGFLVITDSQETRKSKRDSFLGIDLKTKQITTEFVVV